MSEVIDMMEILSYNTSILNPLLKLIIFLLFLTTALLFYRCHQKYGGILGKVSTLLALGALAGALAAAFRYQGDFFVQYKWGESVFDLALAVLTLIIALIIRAKMNDVTRLFSEPDGEEGP
jgi:hypothetical protein